MWSRVWLWLLENLDQLGSIAAIGAFMVTLAGAGVGIWGYCSYRLEFRRKRKALESYIATERQKARENGALGQKSMLNIIRYVGLTEDEILKISFASDKIARKLSKNDKNGFADRLLFQYVGDR